MPHFLAHFYHASKISKNPQFLYGAVFPDNFFFIKKRHSTALKFAKNLANKKEKYKPFYEGVKLHIKLDKKIHTKVLPYKIQKVRSKFNISSYFAHSILEIALDYNLYKEKRKQINHLLVLFNKFNPKEIIYYLSTFIKINKKILTNIMKKESSLIKLSTKFSISSFLERGKIVKQYFKKEVQNNISFIRDLPKLIRTFRYSVELTKDYEEFLV